MSASSPFRFNVFIHPEYCTVVIFLYFQHLFSSLLKKVHCSREGFVFQVKKNFFISHKKDGGLQSLPHVVMDGQRALTCRPFLGVDSLLCAPVVI